MQNSQTCPLYPLPQSSTIDGGTVGNCEGVGGDGALSTSIESRNTSRRIGLRRSASLRHLGECKKSTVFPQGQEGFESCKKGHSCAEQSLVERTVCLWSGGGVSKAKR